MNNTNYTIRAYSPGDESGIVALFSLVFHQEIDIHYWKWKYSRTESIYALVIESNDNNEIIGHVGAIPLEGLYKTQTIPCFQMCDVMIHPDARGFLGERNLFTRLFKEISEFIAKKHANAFCFGFPGRRPFLLGQRARAYSRVEQPVISELPATTYTRKRLLQLRHLTWSDTRLNKIWQRLSYQYKLVIIRDQSYLNWRYASHPFFDYQLVGFYFLGFLTGWAVVRSDNNSLYVVDLLIHKRWLKSVVKTLSCYASTLKLDNTIIWLPDGWRDIKAKQSLSEIVTTNVTWHLPMETTEVQQYFYYTMGDLDIF